MTDEDKAREIENAIYYYRPQTDREKKLIELLVEEKIKEIEKLKNNYKKQRNRRIDELQKENAKLKKYCDCEYCHKNNIGEEFTIEGKNKTVCEYCLENNKMFFEV